MNQLLFMVHNSLELYEDLCQPVCKMYGMPQTAFDIVMFLANNPEYYTARDICKIRGIKPNLVSFHVEKLVQEGYLKREAIPGDRRQVKLLCTEKAQGLVKRGREVQRNYREILTQEITPSDMEAFQRCMDTIRKNIEKIKEKGDKKR